jgi:small-conductance mechanosensitive channel
MRLMDSLRELWNRFVDADGPMRLLFAAIIIAGAWLTAVGFRWLTRLFLRRLRAKHPAGEERTQVFGGAERPLSKAIVVIGLYLAFEQLPDLDRVHAVVSAALFILGTLLVVRGLSLIVTNGVRAYAEHVAARHKEEPDVAFFTILRKLGVLVVWLLGTIAVLAYFHQNVVTIVAALGAGSVALGLAAQQTLANMVAGFVLLLDRPFREGDRIQLSTGEVGDVKEIGVRSTKIQLGDGTLLIAPNSDLVNLRLINFLGHGNRCLGKVAVTIGSGADLEESKRLLLGVAGADSEVLADPAPAVDLVTFTGSAMELRLSFWVRDYVRVGVVADRIRLAAYEKLREAGLQLALPTQVVLLRPRDENTA